ncbi:MAG: recombination mediator RecR [Candidatus Moraniibacteriota bacterium]
MLPYFPKINNQAFILIPMYPKPFQKLIEQFVTLPSIGPRLAERLVLYLFKQDQDKLESFAEALENLHQLHPCKRCFHIAEDDLCTICTDSKRDQHTLCVVEEALDIIAFERLGRYRGRYHVLGGVMEGSKDSSFLHIPELLDRIETEHITEVILATNPTTEGDLTALYIKKKIENLGISVTRLARGLSSGGDIEYADELTLSSALTNRKKM